MDIYTFYKTSTKAEVRRVCDLLGISIIQWRNYANGYARPSLDRALMIELASGGKITLREILQPTASMPKLYKYNKRKTQTGKTTP